MNIPNRKPELNTESMSVWKEKEEDFDKAEGIKVKYKDMEIELLDFKTAKDSKGEIIFAWKVKPSEKIILFHKIKKVPKTDKLEILLKGIAQEYRYNLQDVVDKLKNIYSQNGSIGKL